MNQKIDNSDNIVPTHGSCQGCAGAYTAVESVLAAMARSDAYNFPVIREAIGGRPV